MTIRDKFRPFLSAARQQAHFSLTFIARKVATSRPWQTGALLIASGLVAITMWSILNNITVERARWQGTRSVVVTTAHVAVGEPITASNTTFARIPDAVAPVDALTALPTADSAIVALEANTPLSSSLVRPVTAIAQVPDGWRKVALPVDVPTPALTPGMHVDVVSAGQTVARDAVVVSAASSSSTAGGQTTGPVVAVPAEIAAQVAAAVRSGDATIVTQ